MTSGGVRYRCTSGKSPATRDELELDVGPADLIKIVRRLATEYQKISPRHTIHLESEVGRMLGDWDEARIERIVANLISNAVK